MDYGWFSRQYKHNNIAMTVNFSLVMITNVKDVDLEFDLFQPRSVGDRIVWIVSV